MYRSHLHLWKHQTPNFRVLMEVLSFRNKKTWRSGNPRTINENQPQKATASMRHDEPSKHNHQLNQPLQNMNNHKPSRTIENIFGYCRKKRHVQLAHMLAATIVYQPLIPYKRPRFQLSSRWLWVGSGESTCRSLPLLGLVSHDEPPSIEKHPAVLPRPIACCCLWATR